MFANTLTRFSKSKRRGFANDFLFSCIIDGDVFHAWTKYDLIPQLPSGAVIVMDTAAFHKRADTKAMIKTAGYSLEYLPPYSPDLSRGSARSGLQAATGSFLRRPSPQSNKNGPKPKPSEEKQGKQQSKYSNQNYADNLCG